MNVWQVSSGDSTRDYSEVFFEFGLMAVGPGTPGPFPDARDDYLNPQSSNYRRWMRPFCEGPEPGDLVVLKRPATREYWEIAAAGLVTSGYRWSDALCDVDGWDLQHHYTVEWKRPTGNAQVTTSGYSRATFTRVRSPEVATQARRLWETGDPVPARELPGAARPIDIENLVDPLIEEGLPVARAEEVVSTVNRIVRLATWYGRHGEHVGEHEIRTFLIVPLLIALGWPEQCIKIEFNRADVALFDRPYVGGGTPTTIIESKRLYEGLGPHVASQAAGYAAMFDSCKRLLVSDGFRYRLILRDKNGAWNDRAYANLLRLRDRDPLSNLDGADTLLLALLPRLR